MKLTIALKGLCALLLTGMALSGANAYIPDEAISVTTKAEVNNAALAVLLRNVSSVRLVGEGYDGRDFASVLADTFNSGLQENSSYITRSISNICEPQTEDRLICHLSVHETELETGGVSYESTIIFEYILKLGINGLPKDEAPTSEVIVFTAG